MKTIKLLILLMVATLGMQSCRKDSDIIKVIPPNPEVGMNVQGSVMGIVIDENGLAVSEATVTFGNLTENTDQFGVFQFNDQTMHSGGTYIKVEKDGYFHGSRKFYPVANATSRVTIELMQMVEIVSFASSAGEKVQFEGVEIAFGNNSIMREDGSDYDGNVKVFAKYLDPTLIETLDQMPGDLTANNSSDERVVLTTYGMLAVELRDDSGNELQIKEGSQADIVMPVPSEILNSAPATIPLWHFDEDLGSWVEEGQATLVNGEYVGQVSHFSFWNYDVPSNFIHLSGSIFNIGVPAQGLLVKITNTDNNTNGTGYTNNLGVFGGYVPKGVTLTLEVYDQCGNLIYTTTVGPYEEDVVLDPFNLAVTALQVTISGTVSSCDGEPSDATYVVIEQNDLTSIIAVEDDNTFVSNVFYCEEGATLTIGAEDPINQLASANSTFTIEGDVDAGILELCEESVTQHLYYEYGDQIFNSNDNMSGQDSTFFFYTAQVINQSGDPDKVIYTVTLSSWTTNSVLEYVLLYEEGTTQQNVTMPVPMGGFNASGVATIQKVSQGGQEFIIASGTLSDIEETDPALYDPSYNPLLFSTAIKL